MNVNDIGREIIKQDNMATDQPVFVVEARDWIVADPDYIYSGDACDFWWNKETDEKFQREKSEYYAALDVLGKGGLLGDEWVHLHLVETWRFVTACFTSAAAQRFIERKAHDYQDGLRVFCYATAHNHEYRAVRDHLISIAELDK